jgi:hypothetical protein
MNDQPVEPEGGELTCPELAHLETWLRNRLAGRVWEFRLQTQAEGLVLSVWASNYHAKQVAQHLVMQATARRVLHNGIEVRRPADPALE